MPQLELPTLSVLSGVRVTRSLDWCVCFVDRCLSSCPFSLDHCVVCPSSIYGFWLSLWYLQTFFSHTILCNHWNYIEKNTTKKIVRVDIEFTSFSWFLHGTWLCVSICPWLTTVCSLILSSSSYTRRVSWMEHMVDSSELFLQCTIISL